MNQELYGTRLYINCSQLKKNISYIKQNSNKSEIIAMVKANAYGCGDIFMTKKMEQLGISYFGVADFEEGVRLRINGIKSPIMVMNTAPNSIRAIIDNKLEPVIYSKEILNRIINQNLDSQTNNSFSALPIHIKINTGMNRWGFNFSEIPGLIKILQDSKKLIIVKSIYSHLPSAENKKDDVFTHKQINNFIKIKRDFDKNFNYTIKTHIHNSFGLIYFSKTIPLFDYSRIGIGLYGGIEHSSLKPITELRCRVSQIRRIKPHETVGYNREFVAKKEMKIAIIPFGYADGLQRSWGNGILKFYYKGHLLPTVGNISMDSCAIDITKIWKIERIVDGDEIIYFGKERPIWELSKELNTIPYEIIATLSRRIKRVYC